MPKTMDTMKTELCSAKKWVIISMNDMMMLLLLMLLIMVMVVIVVDIAGDRSVVICYCY